jgi:cell division protein DivIC
MAGTAVKRRRQKANFGSYVGLSILILLICGLIWFQASDVKAKLAVKTAENQELDAQIAAEEERPEEIEEFEKYVQTKAYAEEQAHEKLGLVNEGEIVFQLDQ